MKDGIDKGGFRVFASNDLRQTMTDFQNRQGFSSTVTGDIGENSTIGSLFNIHSKSCLFAGGFSCQPWSALGDRKGMMDTRSQSLISTLRAAYFLRSHSIVLECVQNAGQDQQVRDILSAFCRITGFRQTQIDLCLATFWPSKGLDGGPYSTVMHFLHFSWYPFLLRRSPQRFLIFCHVFRNGMKTNLIRSNWIPMSMGNLNNLEGLLLSVSTVWPR